MPITHFYSFFVNFGVYFVVDVEVMLALEKRPQKKKVEKVKFELSCRRQADFRGSKGSGY